MPSTSITFYGAKGGQGTSVLAAATAIRLAEFSSASFLVTKSPEEAKAILGGLPTGVSIQEEPDCPTEYNHTAVYDVGPRPGHLRVLVVRNCYLALKAALALPQPNLVVVMVEAERSLGVADVAEVLGLPAEDVLSIPVDAATARAVDAGMLSARLPKAIGAVSDLIIQRAAASVV